MSISGIIRELEGDLELIQNDIEGGKEKACAITKLQECIMWLKELK